MRSFLKAWFICRVLGWHIWVEEERYRTKMYRAEITKAESESVLPISVNTKILRSCDRCQKLQVVQLDGDWSGSDDGGGGDDGPAPTPEDLERMYQQK